jgi:N-acetyl-S-(2-succino)cysteine monooxygenase
MMILGANARALGAHLGGWRHPDSWKPTVMSLQNAITCAQIAERGKFDLIFLADGNGVRQMDKTALFEAVSPSDRPAVFEPVTLLSAIAMVTKHVGLVATATTTYEEPYLLARKFASLDHLSNGRAGWNLVTTSNAEDALNFGRAEHVARDERYERAKEFAIVVKGLWDSWAEDAFPENQSTGQLLDSTKVHLLNHKGKFFSVRGPLNVARPPQGHPVLFSAGQSEPGKELTAALSDCMFASGKTKEDTRETYVDIKSRMAKYGRSPDSLKILPGLAVYVGKTEAAARKLYEDLHELISPKVGVEYLSEILNMDISGYPLDGPLPEISETIGGTSGRYTVANMAKRENLTIRQTYQRILGSSSNTFIGDPIQIADAMEDWYKSQACDGFILGGGVMPGGLADFVDMVVPELQRRGLYRKEYEGATMRENLGLQKPPSQFFSTAAIAAE